MIWQRRNKKKKKGSIYWTIPFHTTVNWWEINLYPIISQFPLSNITQTVTIFVKEVHNKPQPSLSPSLFFSFFLLRFFLIFSSFFFLHFKICKPNPRWYCWRFDSYPIEDNWSNWGYFQTAQGHLSKAVQNQCKKNYLGRNQVPKWYLYFWTFPSSTIS